jgi:hypothetical protein
MSDNPIVNFGAPGATGPANQGGATTAGATGATAVAVEVSAYVAVPMQDGLHSHTPFESVQAGMGIVPPTASTLAGPLDLSLIAAAIAVAGLVLAGRFSLRLLT